MHKIFQFQDNMNNEKWAEFLVPLINLPPIARAAEKSGKSLGLYFVQGDLTNHSIVVCENPVIVRWNDVSDIDIRLDDAAKSQHL